MLEVYASRCPAQLNRELRRGGPAQAALGLQVRIGLDTGHSQTLDGKVKVAADRRLDCRAFPPRRQADHILVPPTVKDSAAAPRNHFRRSRDHKLKGV
jgi:hypothetical protein